MNFSDSGAPFYDVYQCADGEYVAVGAFEPQFYAELLRLTGLAGAAEFQEQHDRSAWPAMRERLAEVFAAKTRAEWDRLGQASQACVTPVLSFAEAAEHPHNVARQTFLNHNGIVQPAPAPRLSRTPGTIQRPAARPGEHTDEVLAEWLDLGPDQIAKRRATGAVA